MRTTVILNDDLVAKAREYTGVAKILWIVGRELHSAEIGTTAELIVGSSS
jgi:hypothetical protein